MTRGSATSWLQQTAMIDWLSIPRNFKLITGGKQADLKGVVAGAKLKKSDAYGELAENVNQKSGLPQ